MKFLVAVLFGASLICGLGGCARDLSRDAAATKIRESDFFKKSINKDIYVGEINAACGEEPSDDTFALEAAGLVRVKQVSPKIWTIELTENGKDTFSKVKADSITMSEHCKYTVWTLPIASPDGIQVTGLSRSDRITEAEFNVHYKLNSIGALYEFDNPIGEKLQKDHKYLSPIFFNGGENVDKHIARFKLFDDGWRLVE